MKIFDGTGTGSEDTLVKLGEEGNTIVGWTIANDTISSNNLVIHSSGRLETSDFASDVKVGEYLLRVMVLQNLKT